MKRTDREIFLDRLAEFAGRKEAEGTRRLLYSRELPALLASLECRLEVLETVPEEAPPKPVFKPASISWRAGPVRDETAWVQIQGPMPRLVGIQPEMTVKEAIEQLNDYYCKSCPDDPVAQLVVRTGTRLSDSTITLGTKEEYITLAIDLVADVLLQLIRSK